jgi:phosphoribosyl 1,2-cyclic phosphodiesterase/uncharacterized protein (UPF0248 family)
MGLRFTMLASGSRGNACLIQAGDFGVLLDAGLGPRQLGDRLRAAGLSWANVHAMLLTHTHSDHWNDRTLGSLLRRRLPLYCHHGHHAILKRYSIAFPQLEALGLVRGFVPGEELALAPGLRCRALPIRHDSGATFGFRLEGSPDLFGRAPAIGYAADLGTWDDELAGDLADVDLLALEFNHDVTLEHRSNRPAALIARVLGDEGHLSNDQAAALVRTILERSTPGRLCHLVQLHLSEDCNRPALARAAARQVLDRLSRATRLHTARQDAPGPAVDLEANGARRRRDRAPAGPKPNGDHPWLPGLQESCLDPPLFADEELEGGDLPGGPAMSAGKKRTGREAVNRVLHDQRLDPCAFAVGYGDRRAEGGVRETPLSAWPDADIPSHRIAYLRCGGVFVWRRGEAGDLLADEDLPAAAWAGRSGA